MEILEYEIKKIKHGKEYELQEVKVLESKIKQDNQKLQSHCKIIQEYEHKIDEIEKNIKKSLKPKKQGKK